MEHVQNLAVKVGGNSGLLTVQAVKPAAELYYKAGTAALSAGTKIVSYRKSCVYCLIEEKCHEVGEVWESKETVEVTAYSRLFIGQGPTIEYHPSCKLSSDDGVQALVTEPGGTSSKWIDCSMGQK